MSLIGKSRFLFLDEPTAGLDSDSKQKFLELVNRIKGHRTIIIITHDLEEANAIADRICIMSYGKVVAIDTP
jgi:ABC-type multidrug transport system ATPase subunit